MRNRVEHFAVGAEKKGGFFADLPRWRKTRQKLNFAESSRKRVTPSRWRSSRLEQRRRSEFCRPFSAQVPQNVGHFASRQMAELPGASGAQQVSLQPPAHGHVEQNGTVLYVSQVPSTQSSAAAQSLPHPPQFPLLVLTSTHALPHAMRPAPQRPVMHVPAEQTCPATHAVPQPPQLFGSLLVSTHPPLQLVRYGLHAHAPAAQI